MSSRMPLPMATAIDAPAAPASVRSWRGVMTGEGIVLLMALIAFGLALSPSLRETGTPPGWDQSTHLRDSVVYENLLSHPGLVTPEVVKAILHGSEEYPLITPSGYYPPLVPSVTALIYLVAGRSYEAAMATNLMFAALLIVGVWGFGNALIGRPAGALAALLVLAAPGIRTNASEYMLDLPLTAMVMLAAWVLLGTRGFSIRANSLLFGAICGLGMLTKWSFFLFLVAPTLLVLIHGVREDRSRGVKTPGRGMNLAATALLAAAIMAPYYAPILPILIRKTWVHAGGAADGFGSPFSAESALFHLEALPRRLLGWPLTLAVLGGVLAIDRKRGERRWAGWFLLLWAASVYAIFTFAVANKQSRYLLPWAPILMLGASMGILDLWRRRHEAGSGAWRAALAVALLAAAAGGLLGSWEAPSSADWNISRLVSAIAKDLPARASSGRTVKLGVIPDMREVNGPTLAYYVSRADLPVSVVQLVNRMKRHAAMEVGLDPFGRGDFYETFAEYDYLVTKTGDNAVPPWESVVPEMVRYFEARKEQFVQVASFREPDGSEMALYRRRDR